jgi:hypothetical protein
MDNNMIAIVSTIMVALGFMNGMIAGSMIETTRTMKLKQLLSKAIDRQFESDLMIDELKKQLAEEKQEKDELVDQLQDLVQIYQRIIPPTGPLQRSTHTYDSESDDEEFSNPASPDVPLHNKE